MRTPGDLVQKDPDSDEPYGFDWTAWLAELGAGVVIGTSIWTIAGDDAVLTQHGASILAGNLKTQVYVAAGTVGKRYTVSNRITTNSSPPVTDERSFRCLVLNR
jgi:hypothetical protein